MFRESQLNALYRYGLSLTNDESMSHDLLQDALEIYLKMDDSRRPTEGAERYIRTIMRNRYIDQLRHRKRFPTESFDEEDGSLVSLAPEGPESLMIDRQMLEHILCTLDPLERELLHCWAYEEMTAQEIAAQLDCPRGTVLSRIHRLRKKIAKLDFEGAGSSREGAL